MASRKLIQAIATHFTKPENLKTARAYFDAAAQSAFDGKDRRAAKDNERIVDMIDAAMAGEDEPAKPAASAPTDKPTATKTR